MTRKLLSAAFVATLAGGMLAIDAAKVHSEPLQGVIQLFPRLTPGGTINARPACHIERRVLCKIGNGSCTNRSCWSNETQVQIGVYLHCDRFVC